MCDPLQRLSWAFDHYYFNQTATNTQNANPCDFSGQARKVNPKPAASCKSVLGQAGAAGTGLVTNAPTATGGSSGAGSSSSKSAAAGAVTVPVLDLTLLKLGAYLCSAIAMGAGLVLM